MVEIVVYGHKLCPDCKAILLELEANQVKFTFADVAADVATFCKFIKLRDARAEFTPVKQVGGIGIPCFVIGDGQAVFFADAEGKYLTRLADFQ